MTKKIQFIYGSDGNYQEKIEKYHNLSKTELDEEISKWLGWKPSVNGKRVFPFKKGDICIGLLVLHNGKYIKNIDKKDYKSSLLIAVKEILDDGVDKGAYVSYKMKDVDEFNGYIDSAIIIGKNIAKGTLQNFQTIKNKFEKICILDKYFKEYKSGELDIDTNIIQDSKSVKGFFNNNDDTSNKNLDEKLTQDKNLPKYKGLESIIGMEELKIKLQEEIILPIKDPEEAKKWKVKLPNGLLLYGPPGCGKTFVSRRLAEELGWNFMELSHGDLGGTLIHETVIKIQKAFGEAEEKAPTIMFFDEIDGLLPNRGEIWSGHDHKLEEVNEFLMHLNDAGKNKILVVGATNYPDKLDPAVLRSGRFDIKLFVGPPILETRIALFKNYLEGRPLTNDIDYNVLGELTENYIISDIEAIVESVARKAFLKKVPISQTNLVETIKETPRSVSKAKLKYFEELTW